MSAIIEMNLGYRQLCFGFDPSHEQDLKKILVHVEEMIAENDRVMLDQVAEHFSMEPDKWPKTYILELLNSLFQDDKIYFAIGGEKILPSHLKTRFSGTDPAKRQFLQAREIISALRTHLSEPARWKYVEIIKPETVEKPDLLKARNLGKKLFGDAGDLSQNSLCRYLRRYLRVWKKDLEMFEDIAGKGQYPGINEIQNGLALTTKVLNVHDPVEFIETFISNEDRLCDAGCHFAVLENFYKNQIHIWNALIKAVDDFILNRALLERNPEIKKSLETLYSILANPKPYSRIKEIPDFISIVKPANDLIVEKQIASEKAMVLKKMAKMIDTVMKVLDEKNATSDTRNKALFTLQSIRKKINAATSLKSIAGYQVEAIDEFEYTMDLLE